MDKKTISEVMKAMGRKGGQNSMAKLTTPEQRTEHTRKNSMGELTPEQRITRAQKAAKARWKEKKRRPGAK
jgi:hypothetical protein